MNTLINRQRIRIYQRARICALLTLALWVALLPTPALAQTEIVHVVQPGENLFRISLRYGTTVDAIMAANGLTSIYIRVGQELVIPGVTAEPAPPPEPTPADDAYVVQEGDTVTGIAIRHGITIQALMDANELPSARVIHVGQHLVVPKAEVVEEAPTVEESNVDTYVVRPGDTLTQIAARFGRTTSALAYLNGIANPSAIYVGQVLRLTGEAPAPSGGGKIVIVDLSEQHLYAYQGDQLVYSFVASSGAAPTYTRAGEFRIQSKIPNAYGSAWNIWMPHWMGIYWAGSTENGIHALPVTANGTVLWAGYLGAPVSYGCIVLGTYEAKLLYDWVDIGTPVSIRY